MKKVPHLSISHTKKVPLSVGGEALKCWSDYLLLFEWLDDNSSQMQSQQANENNSQYFFYSM
ncbi:hypothetical protein [Avibacterium avium]|uniref:hypothetical protein n=1 Tax=Avibacterium avium TaxID=751 RepID=UPI003BF7B043